MSYFRTQKPILKNWMVGACFCLIAPLALAETPANATPTAALTAGSPFPTLTLTDQHDKPVILPGVAHAILFANAKAVDEWVNPILTEMGQANLSARQVIYLSDISRMPWMVSKLIALPQMRERNYSAALIRDDQEKAGMPIPAKGCADLLQLKAGVVESIQSVCTPAELKTQLEALPAMAPIK
ncbi:MAG: hypothetical protein ACYC3A_01045 [Halothiobacillus sp.]